MLRNYRTSVSASTLNVKMSDQKPVPRIQINRIAGAVDADPRTVRKVLDGKPVRGGVAIRIKEEAQRRGLRT